ncbi:hypothetical protein TNCV_2452831 [Trichonephila clavipes]|nr:hypothetical protein TNCV_2452831 [Trichonephila clavipes]
MWTKNYSALGQTARVCFGVGQVCPDVDKELWRLGTEGSGVFLACYAPIGRGRSRETLAGKDKRVRERERTEGGRRDGKRVGERESEARLEWRKGLSPRLE